MKLYRSIKVSERMPAPGIYHVIGTEVNGSRRIESATFEDGYYDDPGYEIEYWLESLEPNDGINNSQNTET